MSVHDESGSTGVGPTGDEALKLALARWRNRPERLAGCGFRPKRSPIPVHGDQVIRFMAISLKVDDTGNKIIPLDLS